MPRAEAGTTKHLANKMKAKGLQRLRWYCQVCEKQCRDENGFKCHVQSESHVRNMQIVGEDPKRVIKEYSQQFLKDFLQLLKTGHGTKQVHLNHFYQDYISRKEHIHMNATEWKSLTHLASYLGREGICKVEETDKGLHIAWIDNSPEALRRQAAVQAKERQERGDEEREQRLIKEQVERARLQMLEREDNGEEDDARERGMVHLGEGEKILLTFGAKGQAADKPDKSVTPPKSEGSADDAEASQPLSGENESSNVIQTATPPAEENNVSAPAQAKMSFGMAAPNKAKNIFAQQKKNNPLATKKGLVKEPSKKMSEAERIMREELERKRKREESGFSRVGEAHKKQRV